MRPSERVGVSACGWASVSSVGESSGRVSLRRSDGVRRRRCVFGTPQAGRPEGRRSGSGSAERSPPQGGRAGPGGLGGAPPKLINKAFRTGPEAGRETYLAEGRSQNAWGAWSRALSAESSDRRVAVCPPMGPRALCGRVGVDACCQAVTRAARKRGTSARCGTPHAEWARSADAVWWTSWRPGAAGLDDAPDSGDSSTNEPGGQRSRCLLRCVKPRGRRPKNKSRMQGDFVAAVRRWGAAPLPSLWGRWCVHVNRGRVVLSRYGERCRCEGWVGNYDNVRGRKVGWCGLCGGGCTGVGLVFAFQRRKRSSRWGGLVAFCVRILGSGVRRSSVAWFASGVCWWCAFASRRRNADPHRRASFVASMRGVCVVLPCVRGGVNPRLWVGVRVPASDVASVEVAGFMGFCRPGVGLAWTSSR